MDYKVIKSNSQYDIFETKTEQVIATFNTETEARTTVRMYNLGGGFSGWTPKFILTKIDISRYNSVSAD
jgi:hypothetical protein